MRRRAGIPVYSAVFPAKIINRISIADAYDRIHAKNPDMEAIWAGRGKMSELVAVKMINPVRDDRPSPSAITASEVRANAGCHGASITELMTDQHQRELAQSGYTVMKIRTKYRVINGPDFVEQSHDKVKFWPVLGDTKAVRVVPPNAFQQAEALMAAGHEG